ncbi:AsmA protein [Hyphomicrobium sp. 1Nfss2.1]|uniref:AsmA family protein n=1 Tax=Hyphomicrobium sp. 1Nfss2.1 TaxID=3413936 RepID=UPI003C7AC0F7
MNNSRPPVRGTQPPPRRQTLGDQRYGANLPHGFQGERRPPAPPPRRSSWLGSVLLYGGVAVLALGVFGATVLVMSPPSDLIRREIISRVKAETGRDLTIAGPASFTFFPSLGLRLNGVSLSAPAGMGGAPLVKAESFDVGVKLMPLLRQEIVVDRLVLNEPVFSLRVDADGRRNWDMAGAEMPFRFAGARENGGWVAGARELIAPSAHAAPRELAALSLDDISIINGAVRYNDERNGAWGRFDGINARFALPGLDQPLVGSGDFLADGETFRFKSTLSTPAELAARRSAKLVLDVSGMPLSIGYDGTIGGDQAGGTLKADAPSLSALAQWWGTPVSPEAGAGAVSFSAVLNATARTVQLTNIDLKAGRTAAAGAVSFEERQGARPHVGADLRISGLDVAALPLGADLRAAAGQGRSVPAPTPLSLDAPAPAEEPQSIDDLLNQQQPGPRVKGYTQRADGAWSSEPIDIKALGLVDADARLQLVDITYGRTKIDTARATVDLKDQVARIDLAEVRLYNGLGKGQVTLDATQSEAAFTSDISLTGVNAGRLLRDSAKVDWLDGTADVSWKVTGRGASEAAIVNSLNGSSRVAVNNGAVMGFDLGGALDELSEGGIPDFNYDRTKRTTFRSMTGSFTIANGIASNSDLKLDSPHLHATGTGSVDLPQRSLDYTVKPKLVANLKGDGGEKDAAGIEVPVHITGSWQQPKFQPDIAGALNSQGTVDAVKQIGKQLKGKNAGEVVKDLFGKSEDGGPSKAQKLLDGLFGKK